MYRDPQDRHRLARHAIDLLRIALAGRRARAAGGRCALCGLDSHRPLDLCIPCESDLPRPGRGCRQCALPLPPDALADRCGACLRRPPQIDHLHVTCSYADPADLLVQGLKFRGELYQAEVMARLMVAAMPAALAASLRAGALLVPAPLHPLRRWQRGFDQAEVLAHRLGRLTGSPVVCRFLRRTRRTRAQSGLDRRGRQHNVRGAFQARGPAPGAHLILVDDVVTTGSTLDALAGTCRRAGAERVDGWCFARTLPGSRH
ncbi:MAG: ComF family protein [Pseudomonadales bacterium]|jgi:ComF family protein|nr:ComF family protein [Pseudomonadales bacterium]